MPRDLTVLPPVLEAALKSPSVTASSELKEAYASLESTVKAHFPSLWPVTHASLSVVASLCWQDFPLPIALIITGPSSSGKTEPLMWIARSGLDQFVRIDSFTPASFVTHAPTVKKTDLEKTDLLPKLRDRCLCTKELAPLFAGREEELRTRFAQLTTVLDGEGLLSASGTQGIRGYDEPINFAWLGATTPPEKRVFNLMAALGTRLFFYSTDIKRPTAADYTALIRGETKHSESRKICQDAVKNYVSALFKCYPTRLTKSSLVTIPDKISETLGLFAHALTFLRGGVSIGEKEGENEDRYAAPTIEHGWRGAHVLAALCRGSALMRGNKAVDQEDLLFVRHVFLSSMPEYRRKVFDTILELQGNSHALEIAQKTGMAKKTALHYLKELSVLGVLEGSFDYEPFKFRLCEEFKGLLPPLPPKPVTPPENNSSQRQEDGNDQNHWENTVTGNGIMQEEICFCDQCEPSYQEKKAESESEGKPYLAPSGDLQIPFTAPQKYHWWNGGQSTAETLKELNAPEWVLQKNGIKI